MSNPTEIEREVVFRDSDWGLGMFDNDDTRAVVTEGASVGMYEIWLMRGTTDFVPVDDRGLYPDEARSLAAMLIAAADEADSLEQGSNHEPQQSA